jgi:hypothetical protein
VITGGSPDQQQQFSTSEDKMQSIIIGMVILRRIVLAMTRKEIEETEYVPVPIKYGNA